MTRPLPVLIDRWMDGCLDDEESAELRAALTSEDGRDEARRLLTMRGAVFAACGAISPDQVRSGLQARRRAEAEGSRVLAGMRSRHRRRYRPRHRVRPIVVLALAAALVVGVSLLLLLRRPGRSVSATVLASQEVTCDGRPVSADDTFAGRVQIAPQGRLDVRLRDGSALQADGPADFVLAGPGDAAWCIDVRRGRFQTRVTPRPVEMAVFITPHVRGHLLGTEFGLHVEDAFSTIEVQEGRVRLTATDAQVSEVAAGSLAMIEPERAIAVAPLETDPDLSVAWVFDRPQARVVRSRTPGGSRSVLRVPADWSWGPEGVYLPSDQAIRCEFIDDTLAAALRDGTVCVAVGLRFLSQPDPAHYPLTFASAGLIRGDTAWFRYLFTVTRAMALAADDAGHLELRIIGDGEAFEFRIGERAIGRAALPPRDDQGGGGPLQLRLFLGGGAVEPGASAPDADGAPPRVAIGYLYFYHRLPSAW
ncbi:MAG: FecR family protein [Planctomycetota bacterium]